MDDNLRIPIHPVAGVRTGPVSKSSRGPQRTSDTSRQAGSDIVSLSALSSAILSPTSDVRLEQIRLEVDREVYLVPADVLSQDIIRHHLETSG